MRSHTIGVVVEITRVMVCREGRLSWPIDADDPGCTDTAHAHFEYEAHRHRTPVVLPDGSTVIAVSFDTTDPYTRDAPPDFGLYLDHRWSPPWGHDHVDWPDFGIPADAIDLRTKLQDLLERARRGERVEMGCLGAHGRTGTALACLVTLAGVPAADAVAWVRSNHCERAVETDAQAAFVNAFGG